MPKGQPSVTKGAVGKNSALQSGNLKLYRRKVIGPRNGRGKRGHRGSWGIGKKVRSEIVLDHPKKPSPASRRRGRRMHDNQQRRAGHLTLGEKRLLAALHKAPEGTEVTV